MLSQKNTKAEILAAYEALSAKYDSLEPATITWPIVVNTAKVAWVELQALVRDTYRFGAWCRKGFDNIKTAVLEIA